MFGFGETESLNQIFEFIYRPSDASQVNMAELEVDLEFNWFIISTSDTEIVIQFNFTDTTLVSYNRLFLDEISIKMNANVFIGIESDKVVVVEKEIFI